MRALTLVATGGIEHLRAQELPKPGIERPDDVLIRVHAAALNRLDLFVADGLPGRELHLSPCRGIRRRGCGGVGRAGGHPRAARRPGDDQSRGVVRPVPRLPVAAKSRSALRSGCWGSIGPAPRRSTSSCPPKPGPDADRHAVARGRSVLAGHPHRLADARHPRRAEAGETVLIWGIGGGVALAALQIARLLGGGAVVTSGSDAKLEMARRLGADRDDQSHRCDVVAEFRRLTGGTGRRRGGGQRGRTELGRFALRCLRRGGRLVTCGATTGPTSHWTSAVSSGASGAFSAPRSGTGGNTVRSCGSRERASSGQ